MNPTAFRRLALVCGAALPFLISCADSGEWTNSQDSEVVASILDLEDRVTVEEGRLVFDAELLRQDEFVRLLAKIDAHAKDSSEERVYLVGGRQAGAVQGDGTVKANLRNGFGYMRRALSWSKNKEGKAVVKTESATLPQVLNEIRAKGFERVSTSSLHALAEAPAAGEGGIHWDQKFDKVFDLRTLKIPAGPHAGKTFAEAPLYELKSVRGQVVATARIKQASIEVGVGSIGNAQMNGVTPHVDADVTGRVGATFEVEIEANLPNAGSFNVEKEGTILLGRIAGTGVGIPATLEATADWSCRTEVGSSGVFSVGVKAGGSVTLGATVDGTTAEMKTPNMDYSVVPILKGTATFSAIQRCEITPKLKLSLFDAVAVEAGVQVWSQGELKINGSLEGASVDAQASLTAGGELQFGGSFAPFGTQLISRDLKQPFGPFDILPDQNFRCTVAGATVDCSAQ